MRTRNTARVTQSFLIASLALTVAATTTPAQTFTIGESFTTTNRSESGFFPPDTMGTVGNDHVVTLINGRYTVHTKTGVEQTNVSLDTFWTDAGVVPDRFSFDPRVLYDPSVDRYFAAAVDNAREANRFLVAVSNTSNPLDGWTGFGIDADADNSNWADFPMLGLNGDRVVVSANMFPLTASNTRTAFLVLPKNDLLGGSVANRTLFEDVSSSTAGFTPQPIFDYDYNTGSLPILSNFDNDFFRRSEIAGTPSAPSLVAGPFIDVPDVSDPPNADQPGSKQNLESGGTRLRSNVIQQNGSFWSVQGTEVDGRAAVQWLEIDTATDTVLQSGTIADPDLAFIYPSISVNDAGDVVIGFSGSSESQFVSAYAVVGATDAGVTTFGNPMLLRAGVDDYETIDGVGRNRWGDYTATVLDPTDDGVFWVFQQYASGDDQWAIEATQIIIPEPASLTALLIPAGLLLVRRRAAVV